MQRSCWACWEEKPPRDLAAFVPRSALPAAVLELASVQEVRPLLCTSCLLAGVNLHRTEAGQGAP